MNGISESEQRTAHLAAAVGLTIDPAYLPAVAVNLTHLLAHAELVMAVPIATETEPAPMFRP